MNNKPPIDNYPNNNWLDFGKYLRWLRQIRLVGKLYFCWLLEAVSAQRELGIRQVIAGDAQARGNCDLVVFAHYDAKGEIDPHVLNYVQKLRETGREVIFVSTADLLPEQAVSRLKKYCREVVHRENRGYDFGSYKTGIARAGDIARYDSLILANDSAYGPLFDLRETIAAVRQKEAEFWGITDSDEGGPHVQSYFMCFEKPVLESKAFRRYWERFPLFTSKLSVIWHGEIGLSKTLRRAGFRQTALATVEEFRRAFPDAFATKVANAKGGDLNLTRTAWRELIEYFKSPLLKVEIVRDQPACSPDIKNWQSVIDSMCDYDTQLIQSHLDRIKA